MCFTGGFALAMMVDDSVAAPVLAQPSLPFPVGKARGADLNLSPADLAKVKERAAAGCQVLGLRYTGDMAVGTRFDTLTAGARRRVHPGRVPRPQALHAHRAPPAGGRRPGAGVLPGEAARLTMPAPLVGCPLVAGSGDLHRMLTQARCYAVQITGWGWRDADQL